MSLSERIFIREKDTCQLTIGRNLNAALNGAAEAMSRSGEDGQLQRFDVQEKARSSREGREAELLESSSLLTQCVFHSARWWVELQ